MRLALLVLGAALPASSRAGATLELAPARVRPGDAFLVAVRGAATPPAGEVAGRPLAFAEAGGVFLAVGALPVEAEAGPLDVVIAVDGVPQAARLEVEPGDFPEKRIRVARRYVEPPPARVRRRIEADRVAFASAFDRPAGPFRFGGRFSPPRHSELTARYGERRTLNGKRLSRHYGADFQGAVGDPVVASQAGQVVLVRDCWASGLSVVLWHGADLFSVYFHLSRAAVQVGDEVGRGQRIGAVGRSGRVTGPHLHWGVKVGERYVDPESVLRLPFDRIPAAH